jgi:transposase
MLHAVCDGDGRPLATPLSEGQMNDHIGAGLFYPKLPRSDTLIADKGYDSDEFIEALTADNITTCTSTEAQPESPARLRQAALQHPPQDLEHVRQPQGLEAHLKAL